MKISACLIVKNEQELLPMCLASIHQWVDEIIVVDTGSEDDTVKIAEAYDAKVYHHPWQNDFSLHRNQSINYATGDWILIVDADETIESDMSQFKKRLKKVKPEVSALVVNVNEISQGKPITSWLGMRFFRKSSGIHYKNCVHNKAVFDGQTALTDIQLYHYGYSLDPEKMEAKRERTESLLKARLAKDRRDHNALYYMTQLKIGEKDFQGAEHYGLRFFECVPVGPDHFEFYATMYFWLAWACLRMRNGEKAYAWAKKGLWFWPDDLDLNYIMARIGWEAKRNDLLKKHSDKYFELLPIVRNRGKFSPGKFENVIDPKEWFNRTTYTVDETAEQSIREFVEELA